MRYKATFLIGLTAGYVLGSRAGRQRFEQIRRMSRAVSNNPTVKQAADRVQAQAVHIGAEARRTVQEKAGTVGHDLVGKVGGRFSHREINLDDDRSYANGSLA
jgi:hypothetical protein